MSTTRQIQDSLKTNNSTASGISAVEPAHPTTGMKNGSSYKYIRITVNDNPVIMRTDCGEYPVPNTSIEWTNEETEKSRSINLLELNHGTTRLFSSVNEQYKIEISFRKDNVTITLPDHINTNLVNFIKLYKPVWNPNYCCINFAFEMEYGSRSVASLNDPLYFHYYQSSPDTFSEDTLSCGDAVHLYDTGYAVNHFAIYLDKKYYISLIGTGGPLLISTLDQLKFIYKSTHVSKIHLISGQDPNPTANTTELSPIQHYRQDPISKVTTSNICANFFKRAVLPATSDVGATITADTAFINFT